jgi:hypothetical protein
VPAVSLVLVILTKSPGFAPISFAIESVDWMYGNCEGEALDLATTWAASSLVRSSCFGIRKCVLTLKAGTSSSTFFLLTVFLVAAFGAAMPVYLH